MVDLRPGSRTRNKWLGVELSAREKRLISERDQACPDHYG
jgi:dTDP-4-dehydrorhamnose 3,5-epimerase-like enzyme